MNEKTNAAGPEGPVEPLVGRPRAWLLEPKKQRYPDRYLIRGCYTTEPTKEQLEIAELDGDRYVPLYELTPN
jgi:hypothetical protein